MEGVNESHDSSAYIVAGCKFECVYVNVHADPSKIENESKRGNGIAIGIASMVVISIAVTIAALFAGENVTETVHGSRPHLTFATFASSAMSHVYDTSVISADGKIIIFVYKTFSILSMLHMS